MNSIKDDKKTQVQSKRDDNLKSVIEDFLKQFGNDGMSAIAHLDKDEQAQVVNWAQDIVNKYGTILKETPMKIKNLVDLPCPKEDLKIAIKVLLPAYIGKGSNDIMALLKDRYVRLSAFQEISQEDQDTIIKETGAIDQKKESTGSALFSTYHKYMEISISEQKILHDEVNTFINDLQNQRKDF